MTSPPTPAVASYPVEIDWHDDGDFTDPIDDVTADVLSRHGGSAYGLTVEIGRDTARSTGPPMIGTASFTLNNQHRGYSPEYGSGPRYQFIKPGRPVRVRALHGTRQRYREHTPYRETDPYRGRASYGLMHGNLETFEQQPEIGAQIVAATALGSMKKLLRQVVSVDLKGSTRTDSAVAYVLDAAGWPSAARSLSGGDSFVHYFWVDEQPAWDVLVKLVATEGPGALLYQDGDGMLYFRNRNHRVTEPRSVYSQATLHDGTLAALPRRYAYTRLRYDPRWADIVSRVTVSAVQRANPPPPTTVVWTLGSDFVAPSGTPRVFHARPSDPFTLAVPPALGTDYTVTGGTATVTLAWTSGAVARIEALALSGTPTVAGLQLRASPLAVIGETVLEASTDEGDASLDKTIQIAAWPELDFAQAQAICDSYLARYRDSRPLIEVTLENVDAETMRAILGVQISDRLTIYNQHLGLDVDVWVERFRHEIGGGGRHTLTLLCEPVSEIGSTGAVWNSALAVWNGPTTLWGV